MLRKLLLLLCVSTSSVFCGRPGHFIADYNDQNSGNKFMQDLNVNLTFYNEQIQKTAFGYLSDMTPENKLKQDTIFGEFNTFVQGAYLECLKYNFTSFPDKKLRRLFAKMFQKYGLTMDNPAESTRNAEEMQQIYSTATVCVKGQCGLTLSPNLTDILAKSRDWDTLKEVWVNWRDASGKKMRQNFLDYLTYSFNTAKKSDLKDYGEYYRIPWEDTNIQDKLENLWLQVKPLYTKLHAFVRKRLTKTYGKNRMPKDGTIPSHTLGNMWAQTWVNIDDLALPFPDAGKISVSPLMVEQNYTQLKMFQLADEFFQSLGLPPMPPDFWQKSMLMKPVGKEVQCHPTAWTMYDKKDFRIKMCTRINLEDLQVAHHEMGHIHYYMLYRNQPFLFQEGANPGFHEAIGDTIALSVSSPDHLKKLNLLKNFELTAETKLNFLMLKALEAVPLMPFGYVMDLVRWEAFAKNISEDTMNRRWWELSLQYQGISPPVVRSELDFDLGAKFHVTEDRPYISYFVAMLLKFQFHQAFCKLAGQPSTDEELFNCDIFGSKEVGQKMADVLKQGSALPWWTQLEQLTGSKELSVAPMMSYFKPLIDFLDAKLKDEEIGWPNAKVDNYVLPANATAHNVQ